MQRQLEKRIHEVRVFFKVCHVVTAGRVKTLCQCGTLFYTWHMLHPVTRSKILQNRIITPSNQDSISFPLSLYILSSIPLYPFLYILSSISFPLSLYILSTSNLILFASRSKRVEGGGWRVEG